MSIQQGRRDFIGMTFAAITAVGGGFTLFAMKRSWDPLPSVKAAGFTTVDLSGLQEGILSQVTWRKKPVFIIKKSKEMGFDEKRDVVVDDSHYTVVIGLCTHLGCIPTWQPAKMSFHCPCHGGEFNVSGVNVFGPPPRPLDIPPFKIDGQKLVLGEVGPEYKKLAGLA